MGAFIMFLLMGVTNVLTTEMCGGKNEEFVYCASPCSETCQTQCSGYLEPSCANTACIDKCECKPGYVRDEITRECVTPENCSPCLFCNGENEHFTQCSHTDLSTCQDYCQYRSKKYHQSCKVSCECNLGYIRNEINNECIKPSQCPVCGTVINLLTSCGYISSKHNYVQSDRSWRKIQCKYTTNNIDDAMGTLNLFLLMGLRRILEKADDMLKNAVPQVYFSEMCERKNEEFFTAPLPVQRPVKRSVLNISNRVVQTLLASISANVNPAVRTEITREYVLRRKAVHLVVST